MDRTYLLQSQFRFCPITLCSFFLFPSISKINANNRTCKYYWEEGWEEWTDGRVRRGEGGGELLLPQGTPTQGPCTHREAGVISRPKTVKHHLYCGSLKSTLNWVFKSTLYWRTHNFGSRRVSDHLKNEIESLVHKKFDFVSICQ